MNSNRVLILPEHLELLKQAKVIGNTLVWDKTEYEHLIPQMGGVLAVLIDNINITPGVYTRSSNRGWKINNLYMYGEQLMRAINVTETHKG